MDLRAANAMATTLVTACNSVESVGETPDSAFAQIFRDFEVIVINDGSPGSGQLERLMELCVSRAPNPMQDAHGLAGAGHAGRWCCDE